MSAGRTHGGHMKRLLLLFPLALFLPFLSGCATAQGVDEHVNFDPSAKTIIYRDQWVRRTAPEVHIEPAQQASHAPTVLFIPFRVTQPMDNSMPLGYTVARVIWQTWNSMRLFPAMEFTGDTVPYRRDRAVQLGRMRGVDMVVGGFVTYAYAGGTAGDSQLSVQIEAHDTQSGQLVWSIAQSGLMPASQTNDYFLFATRTRLPSDPMHAITKAIAIDTGKVIQNWIAGSPPPAEGMRKIDERVRDVMYGDKDPVPAPRSDDLHDPGRVTPSTNKNAF